MIWYIIWDAWEKIWKVNSKQWSRECSLEDIIKEKLNEFKDELLTEIKLLIKSEVNGALKKQKEEFDAASTQLEKHITKLENDNDDLEQYGRHVCLRIEDIPVANEETVEEVFMKTENLLKKVCPNLSGDKLVYQLIN